MHVPPCGWLAVKDIEISWLPQIILLLVIYIPFPMDAMFLTRGKSINVLLNIDDLVHIHESWKTIFKLQGQIEPDSYTEKEHNS